jgi:hypothetical protein
MKISTDYMPLLNVGYLSPIRSTATVRDFEILSEEFNPKYVGLLEFLPQIKANKNTTTTTTTTTTRATNTAATNEDITTTRRIL